MELSEIEGIIGKCLLSEDRQEVAFLLAHVSDDDLKGRTTMVVMAIGGLIALHALGVQTDPVNLEENMVRSLVLGGRNAAASEKAGRIAIRPFLARCIERIAPLDA